VWFDEGKVAVITGGSSGIGLAIARELLRRGLSVALLARRKSLLKEAKASLGGGDQVVEVSADVTKFDTLTRARKQVEGRFGRIDLLVNCAGTVKPSLLSEITKEDMVSQVDVNLLGLMKVTQLFLDLIERDGAIINISSVFGLFGLAGYTSYAASKFGIVGFSDSLRRELFERHISVHVAFPPDTDTPQYRNECEHMPEWMKGSSRSKPLAPEVVAERVLRGASRGRYLILPNMSTKFYSFMLHYLPRISRVLLDKFAPGPS